MNSDTELPRQQHTAQKKLISSFKTLKPLEVLIIILLIVLVAGTGGYLLGIRANQNAPQDAQRVSFHPSPTITIQSSTFTSSLRSTPSTETAHWKTYKNEQLEISFRYPNAWEAKSRPLSYEKGKISHEVVDLVFKNPKEYRTHLASLYYYLNPNNLSLKSFEQERKQIEKSDLVPPIYLPSDEPRLLSNGLTAYYRKNVFCEPAKCEIYIIPFKNRVFVFYNFQYNQVPDQNHIFGQILSTFKFSE